MKIKKLGKRYAGLAVALFICSLGVALTTNAFLGTSPISSLPYVFTFIVPLTFGTVTFLINVVLFAVQKLILGKEFGLGSCMQLPAVFVFGLFIDFWMYVTTPLVSEVYWCQLSMCILGSFILGLGVSLEIVCNATVLPGEGIVVALAYKTHKNFGNIKVLFDSSLVILSALIGWVALGSIVGLREGTLLSAVLVGPAVKLFSRWTRHLAPFFQ